MNIRTTVKILGRICLAVAGLMLIPFILSLVYAERSATISFVISLAIMLVAGCLTLLIKSPSAPLKARGGFIVVALSWVLMSILGALPFYFSKSIPNFVDCLFETVSGFTTTGASILSSVEGMAKSMMFWRCLTHWIGGMGVLVLVVAVLPKSDANAVHLLKAEVPGPQFGKLVSKLRFSARILYSIYVVLTVLEAIFLLCGGLSLYDSILHSLSTAGTGGFSSYNSSIAQFDSVYVDVVITVFMAIFSVNFNLFYFILIGHIKDAIASEELRWMLGIFAAAIIAVTVCLSVHRVYATVGQSLRYASFQVVSAMSTTGFATADFSRWPVFAQVVLITIMFIGGSAGSTAGGIKVSRIIILFKNSINNVKRAISPRSVLNTRLDKRPIPQELSNNVNAYLITYLGVFALSLMLISIFEKPQYDFTTNFTAIVACINNVGPGLGLIGPLGNYGGFTMFSKVILSLNMLIGRLEVLPLLMLFSPRAWEK